jgi:hypothetical protein
MFPVLALLLAPAPSESPPHGEVMQAPAGQQDPDAVLEMLKKHEYGTSIFSLAVSTEDLVRDSSYNILVKNGIGGATVFQLNVPVDHQPFAR